MVGTQLPVLVGGVLPLDAEVGARWPPAVAWRLPVGAAERLGEPRASDEPPFQLNRGVVWSGGRASHQGVDLANGRGGDPVCAAAAGLVALAMDGDNGNGYGGHVVLAHTLVDDEYVYSIYAHMARGSIVVRAGDLVAAGDPIGRVGQTGRASTPHLHFEVRACDGLDERWEHAQVLDPLAFIETRVVPAPFARSAGSGDAWRAYAHWGRECGLLPRGADAMAPIVRAEWWRMLALAAVGARGGPEDPPQALLDSLIEASVLPEEEAGAPADERLGWTEMSRDVKRLRQLGVRLPHGPLARADHEAACRERLQHRAPAAHVAALRRRAGEPAAVDACMLLADLRGPREAAELGRGEAAPGRARATRSRGRK